MKNHEGEGLPTYPAVKKRDKGTGPDSAGQSGDTQDLPDVAESSSESVTELVEEGQSLEAELLMGVEEAQDETGPPSDRDPTDRDRSERKPGHID